ncbi:MAG: sel1 repeat family protein [Proteobacteria bacterium]|nr:sel1 repeat family protein [Pseudomonadota bacterium]
MQEALRNAHANAQRAIGMTRIPVSAYALAMRIERFLGSRASVDKQYARAINAIPDSTYVRRAYLLAIDARWYGSLADVAGQLREYEQSPLPELSRRFLAYEGTMQLGETFLTSHQDDAAAEMFRLAAPMCAVAESWERLADLYNRTKQWQNAIEALDRYLEMAPAKAWAIRRQGFAYEQLGDWRQANVHYKSAAELGDAYAQNSYGWSLYTARGVTRNITEAIRWFRAAAGQGNANARVNLEAALSEQDSLKQQDTDPVPATRI